MSDPHPVGPNADPVQAAMEYRDRLKAELAMVEAFLAMAEELSGQSQLEELGAWFLDDTEVPITLY